MDEPPDAPPRGGPWRPLLIGLEGVFVLGPTLLLAWASVPVGISTWKRFWYQPGNWPEGAFAMCWWLGAVTLFCGVAVYLRLMMGEWVPSRLLLVLAVLGAVAAVGLTVGLMVSGLGLGVVVALPLMMVPVYVFALRAATARTGERR